MKRPTRPIAAVAALALLVQSTGAASLPVAMLHSTGAFPPPAARLAVFPPRAAQAASAAPSRFGETVKNWFESAGVVARALMETPQEPSARAAEPEEVRLIAAPPRAEVVETATDRMLVVMEKGRRLESVIGPGERSFSVPPPGAAARAFPTLPDFHEAWIEQGGLRAQVSYKNPHGIVTGNENGYRAVFAEGTERLAPVRNLTAPYRRAFPIYWHDETVDLELVIENNTGRTLRHVRVQARADGNVHAVASAAADETVRDCYGRLIGIHRGAIRSRQSAIIEGDVVQADLRGRDHPDRGQAGPRTGGRDDAGEGDGLGDRAQRVERAGDIQLTGDAGLELHQHARRDGEGGAGRDRDSANKVWAAGQQPTGVGADGDRRHARVGRRRARRQRGSAEDEREA